ncbi:MAG: TlpA disulfide reductase family protein [Polaromonas sp.]|uniref:TlpA family protein disulfide reductase n=1 Tax=Polaromonas sp. TaxID=1869339 RepID=UPI00273074B2|nr:TlpA disulfide reductase family protein [Polaromonas sp.]MDP1742232.1 TlpA disulfide reductase family protein [Polaromonas sp.]MDP3357325.1 TlpA disulfide reductase family protein [Polaromonas sp.]MDP3751082.1 TlpA disulfide reductase family protein [Polaromonas sp.]
MELAHRTSPPIGPRRSGRSVAALLAFVALGLAAAAQAQTPPPAAKADSAGAAPHIEGRTVEGKPFRLASLKGKVVLVLYWSTGCAVCRDKMPELRTNYEGWAGKPFELVAVATDKRMQDVLDYERIISRTVPTKQQFVQLWMGDSSYRDNLGAHAQLPAGYLIDKSGKIVERYSGRIPPEAWDRIADLL